MKSPSPPVTGRWLPDLTIDDYLRWPAFQSKSAQGKRFTATVRDVLDTIESDSLIEPRFAYRTYDIAGIGNDWIDLGNGPRISDFPVTRCRLERARIFTAAVGTLGPKLEKCAADWFRQKAGLKAFALIEIGTATLFGLSNFIKATLADLARARRFGLGVSISPGNREIGLEHQRLMVALAGGEEIGVRVSSGAMMSPVNSLSMAYGAGPGMVPHQTLECEICDARERCRFRKVALAEAAT